MAKAEALYNKMFLNYPDVVGVPELMRMLSVGRQAAYQLVRSGEIRSFKVGRNIKIPKLNIIEFLISAQGGDACETDHGQPPD